MQSMLKSGGGGFSMSEQPEQIETPEQILFGKDSTRCLYPEDEDLPEILAALDRYYKAQIDDIEREAYVRGVYDFSNYYMDASMPGQRIPIMPDIAKELVSDYKPVVKLPDDVRY